MGGRQDRVERSDSSVAMEPSEEKKSNSDRLTVSKTSLGPSFTAPPPPPPPPAAPPSVQQLSGHPPPPPPQTSSYSSNMMYTGYSDGYLHMIAPYLANTATGYKSVDPYFLSQGRKWEM